MCVCVCIKCGHGFFFFLIPLRCVVVEELIAEFFSLLRVIVLVWFVLLCVYAPSSPRHGWTGRVRSHERTIHEDRGGLPARLLSHWQREVSDGRRLARTHSYALASLLPSICTPLFTVHSYSLCFSPSSASHSTKTINLASMVSLPEPLAVVVVNCFCSQH